MSIALLRLLGTPSSENDTNDPNNAALLMEKRFVMILGLAHHGAEWMHPSEELCSTN